MNTTDLERELRATLIAAGQQAPVIEDLVPAQQRPFAAAGHGWHPALP